MSKDNVAQEKINQLADFLGIDSKEIQKDDSFFYTPQGEYLVMTETEALSELEEVIESIIEDSGINGFGDFKEEILDKCLNTNALHGLVYENVMTDINSCEDGEFLDKCVKYAVLTKDEADNILNSSADFIGFDKLTDKLIDAMMDDITKNGKTLEYLYDNLGEDETERYIVDDVDVLNIEEIARVYGEKHGYGYLLTDDGITNRTADFYVFKLNDEDNRNLTNKKAPPIVEHD